MTPIHWYYLPTIRWALVHFGMSTDGTITACGKGKRGSGDLRYVTCTDCFRWLGIYTGSLR